jgi:hypothetical protein
MKNNNSYACEPSEYVGEFDYRNVLFEKWQRPTEVGLKSV